MIVQHYQNVNSLKAGTMSLLIILASIPNNFLKHRSINRCSVNKGVHWESILSKDSGISTQIEMGTEGNFSTGFFAQWIHYSGWIRELI